MRVTNNIILNTITQNISRSQQRYLAIQNMASTGRRINKPSDDPIGVTQDLGYRSTLSDIGQYQKNIDHAKSWLSFSDQALGNISDLTSSAQELMVQMGNDTYDAAARQSAACELDQIINQILDASNSKFEGKYIFSGTKTDGTPLAVNAIGAAYQGDDTDLTLESEPSSYLRINSLGSDFLTKAVRTLGDGADLNPGLQPSLWLNNLHHGDGADLGAGLFKVRTLNGEFTVDVSAAKNIGDVLAALNNAGIPNFNAAISENGNDIALEDTSAHQITNDTPLALLNLGQGVDLTAGMIHFSDGNSINVDVDISDASTVGDVIDAINSKLVGAGVNNVTASISAGQNSLVITDSNETPLSLTISEASPGAHTAADLGILGNVGSQLLGGDLKPYQIQVVENADGQNTANELGILKSTEFSSVSGDDLNPDLAYFTQLSSLNDGRGIPLGKIRIINGLDYKDIDFAPLAANPNATIMDVMKLINSSGINVEAKINDQHTGITITSTKAGGSLQVIEADDGQTAKDLGIFGSPDLMGNILISKRALERNDTDEINQSLQTFDGALKQVLVERADVGARVNRAQTSSSRLLSFQTTVTGQLSNIEDADITKVMIDMASAESVYQSALASAAKMMQPSLIDFLQ